MTNARPRRLVAAAAAAVLLLAAAAPAAIAAAAASPQALPLPAPPAPATNTTGGGNGGGRSSSNATAAAAPPIINATTAGGDPAQAPRLPAPSAPAAATPTGGGRSSNATAAAAPPIINATTAGGDPNAPPQPVVPLQTAPGWRLARASFYGAPASFSAVFDPIHGPGSFGVLPFGSCGFTNADSALPPELPRDAVAAVSDASPDAFPASCGRCFELRCRGGVLLDNDLTPVPISGVPYFVDLAAINPTLPDTFGRRWPGNALRARNASSVACWAGGGSADARTLPPGVAGPPIVVRIVDSCPCRQVLPSGAPGVAAGGEVRRQHWCCGGQTHFDLSFWAFERLAHPLYGVQQIEYRPVACPTDLDAPGAAPSARPLPFSPPRVSRTTVYGPAGTGEGWGWQPFEARDAWWRLAGAGPSPGAGATCLTISPGGGLSFRCRGGCDRQGLRPLEGARALRVVVRGNSNSSDPFFSATPTGAAPPLKLFALNEERQQYCGREVALNETTPASRRRQANADGVWHEYEVPVAALECAPPRAAITLGDITNLSLGNVAQRDAYICLAALEIVR